MWYDPRTWFGNSEFRIFCDYSGCKKEIKERQMEFDPETGSLYHIKSECANLDYATKVFETGSVMSGTTLIVPRKVGIHVAKMRAGIPSSLEKKVK